ncbi:MAG: ATPase, partial [Selenomonadaceae bacterium]|nr:ATPase [Selenomonadaceae bacterium]
QVSASIIDPTTFQREIRPLKQIQDNYPKFILSLDDLPLEEDGILQKNIIEWLRGAAHLI